VARTRTDQNSYLADLEECVFPKLTEAWGYVVGVWINKALMAKMVDTFARKKTNFEANYTGNISPECLLIHLHFI
jgi:hypothetical protein